MGVKYFYFSSYFYLDPSFTPRNLEYLFYLHTIIRSKLYFALRRHVNQIQALQAQRAAPKSNSELENAMKLRKSAVSVLYLYFVFILCYLPIYSSLAVRINFGLRRFSGPPLNNF